MPLGVATVQIASDYINIAQPPHTLPLQWLHAQRHAHVHTQSMPGGSAWRAHACEAAAHALCTHVCYLMARLTCVVCILWRKSTQPLCATPSQGLVEEVKTIHGEEEEGWDSD